LIDLHIHTKYSDGTSTVEEILKGAERRGLTTISITDHNTIEAYNHINKINVKGLKPGVLDGRKYVYYQSPVFEIDEKEVVRFDDGLECWEKKYQPSQEEFYIHSHSIIK
jgi:histidinol phosphatase-like PHP family hydrolase